MNRELVRVNKALNRATKSGNWDKCFGLLATRHSLIVEDRKKIVYLPQRRASGIHRKRTVETAV